MAQPALAEQVMALARSRSPEDRERLILAVADLCRAADTEGQELSPDIAALIEHVFMRLVDHAERDIRRLLAEKIADAAWAPQALVNVLALDEIDIARPVIAASPVLKDPDLIRLLVQASVEHQIEVARRPRLSPAVVAAVLRQAEPAVLAALAGNDTAEISPEGMYGLVEAAHHVAAVRSPLARHPRLTTDMAQKLYLWVGQSLRAAIVARFRIDPAALDAALAEAVGEAHDGRAPAAEVPDPDREDMEQRLIAKLHDAGQLRPGFLLRVLSEGKLGQFIAALSVLGGFRVDEVRRALASDRPELLAMALVAVGMDRSVFPTVLARVRELNNGLPGGGAEAGRRAAGAFAVHEPKIAIAAFRRAVESA